MEAVPALLCRIHFSGLAYFPKCGSMTNSLIFEMVFLLQSIVNAFFVQVELAQFAMVVGGRDVVCATIVGVQSVKKMVRLVSGISQQISYETIEVVIEVVALVFSSIFAKMNKSCVILHVGGWFGCV
jgi:hypothetical protein